MSYCVYCSEKLDVWFDDYHEALNYYDDIDLKELYDIVYRNNRLVPDFVDKALEEYYEEDGEFYMSHHYDKFDLEDYERMLDDLEEYYAG